MKFSLGILALFLTVIYLKENEASSFQVSFDQRPEQKINSTSKQIRGAVADKNEVFDEVVSDSGDSLSGNRIEGLPNITDLRYKLGNSKKTSKDNFIKSWKSFTKVNVICSW